MVMPVIQYAPETCAWCEGNGKFGEYHDVCLVCNGQGSVLVAQPAHKCPQCDGSGSVYLDEFRDRCKTCGGTGWSHVLKSGSVSR
jgi:DnaJ-class molecular chaperone